MRVLVNALCVTNLSGRHVVLGHLSRLANWSIGEHEYVVLYHEKNRDIRRDLGENVRWIECPKYTANWFLRSLWEQKWLPAISSRLGVDIYFTPSGTAVHNLQMRQVTFAQNPWCLVNRIERRGYERIKAMLQRKAYKDAMKFSKMMVFNSEFMRQAYRKNAGFREKRSEIVYQGIDEETHATGERLRDSINKRPYHVLTVSVMAPHKGVETLVQALNLLRKIYNLPVTLSLVGAWPDRGYEKKIGNLIRRLGVEEFVEITGHVSRPELYRRYAESKVFCLMSRCESFGIPAIEAQAFGTPVVSSNCCAIPEICGNGGVYPSPDNAKEVAIQIATLLEDRRTWEDLSDAAVQNASRYRWEICSRPLMGMFDVTSYLSKKYRGPF